MASSKDYQGRMQTTSVLTLTSVVMDDVIAKQILTFGQSNKKLFECYSTDVISILGEKATGSKPQKKLSIVKNIQTHENDRTSYRRACAAAAFYVLSTRSMEPQADKLTILTEWQKSFTNSLAEAYGFPKASNLYFLYNYGLEFLAELYPATVSTLLGWRIFHLQALFGLTDRATNDEIADTISQAIVYYEPLIKSKKDAGDDTYNLGTLWSEFWNGEAKEAIDFLKSFVPVKQCGRRARRRPLSRAELLSGCTVRSFSLARELAAQAAQSSSQR